RLCPTLSTTAASWYAAWANANAATRAQIHTLHRAALRLRVDGVVISRINLRIKTIAPTDAIPVSVCDAKLAPDHAWTTPRAVVLQTTVHVIRLTHVNTDRVELRGRNRVDELPRRTLIVTDVQATIVSDH